MNQKCTEEAFHAVHVIATRVRNTNRDGVLNSKQKNAAMILSVILFRLVNHARQAFHDYLVVDVSVMSHLMCFAVVIIHLAVYEVISLSSDFHGTCRLMVQDAANLVTHVPVGYEVAI